MRPFLRTGILSFLDDFGIGGFLARGQGQGEGSEGDEYDGGFHDLFWFGVG